MAGNLTDEIRGFLAAHTVLSLATVGPKSKPQVADVYYVQGNDPVLYFASGAHSRHAGNIARDPRVAGTIHALSTEWRGIRGVQMEGTCAPTTGLDQAKAWTRYTTKYPFVLSDPALIRALGTLRMYRFTPHWLRWIDNSIALGHNVEYLL